MISEGLLPGTIQRNRGTLIATLQTDLTEDVMGRFSDSLLAHMVKDTVTGVILDVSGVPIIDSEEFERLRRLFAKVRLMGAKPVLVGLSPGVVASLITLEVNTDGVVGRLTVEAASDWLRAAVDG